MSIVVHHLAIDPSVKSLGWAMYTCPASPAGFSDAVMRRSHLEKLSHWQYGTLKIAETEFLPRLLAIKSFFESFQHIRFRECIIEMPTFYGTEKGRIAARMGYTIGLGAVLGITMGAIDSRFTFYTATEWKGTVTKDMTLAKLKRKMIDWRDHPALSKQNDAVDAIMMLYHHLTK